MLEVRQWNCMLPCVVMQDGRSWAWGASLATWAVRAYQTLAPLECWSPLLPAAVAADALQGMQQRRVQVAVVAVLKLPMSSAKTVIQRTWRASAAADGGYTTRPPF